MPRKSEHADNVFLLTLIKKLKPEDRGKLINHLNNEAIELLTDSVHHIINVDIGLSSAKRNNLKKKLSPSKKNFYKIADRSIPIQKRRQALVQEGEGLGLILSAAIPLISNLISGLVNK